MLPCILLGNKAISISLTSLSTPRSDIKGAEGINIADSFNMDGPRVVAREGPPYSLPWGASTQLNCLDTTFSSCQRACLD